MRAFSFDSIFVFLKKKIFGAPLVITPGAQPPEEKLIDLPVTPGFHIELQGINSAIFGLKVDEFEIQEGQIVLRVLEEAEEISVVGNQVSREDDSASLLFANFISTETDESGIVGIGAKIDPNAESTGIIDIIVTTQEVKEGVVGVEINETNN